MSKSDAIVHLRIPAATKGRWVRASRAAGMRLTDWIVDAVEAHMQKQLTQITIPDDLDFADLKLAREPADGSMSFEWSVIERICQASDTPIELFRDGPEDNVAALITVWYRTHLENGGARDPVADDLIVEAFAEERAGQSASHQPGHA